MSDYIERENAKKVIRDIFHDLPTRCRVNTVINMLPSIDLADYVPKEFHDKTCEAMAKRHQEEIADMVSVVRCKECRHWKWIEWAKEYRCTVRNTAFNARADDYCSYGERREP